MIAKSSQTQHSTNTSEKNNCLTIHLDEYKDNIFTKMISGEMEVEKAYENNDCIVIMDITPKTYGHCLVIPKVKARNILDISAEDLRNLVVSVQKVAIAAKIAFKADGITILQNNEEAGGQCIFHLHFHIIPQYKEEKSINLEQLNKLANKLNSFLC